MNWVYENDFNAFLLNIGPYLVSQGILLAEVTEAVYMVKNASTDTDERAKAALTIGAGLTVIVGATEADAQFSVKFSQSDFGATAMQSGETYQVKVGIKTAAMTTYLEADLTDSTITITEDFIRG